MQYGIAQNLLIWLQNDELMYINIFIFAFQDTIVKRWAKASVKRCLNGSLLSSLYVEKVSMLIVNIEIVMLV